MTRPYCDLYLINKALVKDHKERFSQWFLRLSIFFFFTQLILLVKRAAFSCSNSWNDLFWRWHHLIFHWINLHNNRSYILPKTYSAKWVLYSTWDEFKQRIKRINMLKLKPGILCTCTHYNKNNEFIYRDKCRFMIQTFNFSSSLTVRICI